MKTALIQAQAQRSEFFLCLVPVLMLAVKAVILTFVLASLLKTRLKISITVTSYRDQFTLSLIK